MSRASAWILFFIGLFVCMANGIAGIVIIGVAILMEAIIMTSRKSAQPVQVIHVPARQASGPVQQPSTGRWYVQGVDRDSRFETSAYYDATTAENAKVKAELDGIIVTKIDVAPASSAVRAHT